MHASLLTLTVSISIALGCSSNEPAPASQPTSADCHPELREGSSCVGDRVLLASCACTPNGYFTVCCQLGHVVHNVEGCSDFAGGPSCGSISGPPDTGTDSAIDAASDALDAAESDAATDGR